MKKLSLKLAFSTVVLGAFLVGCGGDNRFVEFEPEDELDKIALETFKKELPDKVAYRLTVLNKDGDIKYDVTRFKNNDRSNYYNYQFRFKDEKEPKGREISMTCYEDTKECKNVKIK